MKNIVMALVALLAGTACVSTSLENAGPSHRFYAAVADYDSAKIHAVEFVRSPAVTVETAENILEAMKEGDRVVGRIVAEVREHGIPANGWEAADLLVREAVARLHRMVDLDASGGVL